MVQFDTGMSERSFAQAKLMQYLDEEGMIVHIEADGTYTFSPWKFSGTMLIDEHFVLVGSDFHMNNENGKYRSLYEILTRAQNDTEKSECWHIIKVLGDIACEAQQRFSNTILPLSGPQGIIICGNSFLFLPAVFCERCLSHTEYMQWFHPAVKKSYEKAYIFMFASLVYTLLCAHSPFSAHIENIDQLISDMTDKAFVPLSYAVYACAPSVSRTIDTVLGQKNQLSLCDFISVLPKEYDELYQHENNTFLESAEHFKLKSQAVLKRRKTALIAKRFLRTHATVINILLIASVCVVIFIITLVHDKSNQPSTLGLSALQTVEAYYNAFNSLDHVFMDNAIVKSKKSDKNNAVSRYNSLAMNWYVTTKMRAAYEKMEKTFSPAQWFLLTDPLAYTVFGISNLKISEIFSNNESAEYDVSFYFFMPNGNSPRGELPHNPIAISYYRDRVKLVYVKNRFLIESITTMEETPIEVDMRSLLKEYDPKARETSVLREYPWMPSVAEFEQVLNQFEEQ